MKSAKRAAWLLNFAMGLVVIAGCDKERVGEGLDTGQGDVDADADSDTDIDIDTETDGDGGITAKGPGADLVGMWGQLINVAVKQTGLPVLPSQMVESRSMYLVSLETDGKGGMTAHEKTCSIKIRLETWLAKSIVPKNFIDHLEVLERRVSVASDEPGTPWISDAVYEVRGAKLQDIENDSLPANNSSEADDVISCEEAQFGSQCDQDEDGHPGVTNTLSGALSCEVYVVQRWHSKLEGQIVDENTIGGPITASFSEQTVIAASQPICLTGDPGTSPVIDACPEHFYFKMVRLKPGATCEDVMALTSCDDDEQACIGDESLPLNPPEDNLSDCRQ